MTNQQLQVLAALKEYPDYLGTYGSRTIGGIVYSTKIPEASVRRSISELRRLGFPIKSERFMGNAREYTYEGFSNVTNQKRFGC